MPNLVDSLVSFFSPVAGVRRHAARVALAHYEAAEPSRHRRFQKGRVTQNAAVQKSAVALREQARHLVRNHDIARGTLRTLVNNVVGPNGIGIEPQPRDESGAIHEEFAAELSEAFRDWMLKPEVTHTLSFSRTQRAVARSWMRDGEVFSQLVSGVAASVDHGTRVPLSLELFEADLVPFHTNEARRLYQGIERNAWGRPVALHAHKRDPYRVLSMSESELKRIPWERVLHVASLDHIGQLRGISEFASVITRLEDIKDYEESERVAAKIAAMLTAYVRKGTPDMYEDVGTDEARQINFSPGMVIDDLELGEEIGMIDSKRPNPNLVTFRQGQLQAVAAGTSTSYSSISKNYNGTYSAQRQELVEQWVHYAVLVDEFVGMFIQPIWHQFVRMAELSGAIRRPRGVDPASVTNAIYVAQAMPWIDPLKEALGLESLVKAGFASEVEVIRKRGKNPRDLLDEIDSWRKKTAERGIVFSSNEAAIDAAMLAAAGDQSD